MAKNNQASVGSISNKVYRSNFSMLCFLLHFIAAVQFGYAVYYDYTYVKFVPDKGILQNPYGGKFKYLTFINAVLQTIYYIISVTNDIVGTNEAAPKRIPLVRKLKDFLMAVYAFPIALNVGITFWTLYGIDRELVFPKALDAIFPNWLNHVMHTNIVVFIMLEMFTSFRVYPKRSRGLLALTIFMLSYVIWLHVIKYNSGYWVYPVLDVLDLPMRIVFFITVLVFTLFLYLMGEFINSVIWNKELKLAQKKVK